MINIENALDAKASEAIDSLKSGGELSEIIEGQTREYWLEFYADEYVNPEHLANLINPDLDQNEVTRDINESAELKIKAEIRAGYGL